MLSKEEERYESELPGLHEARQKLFGWLTLMDPEDPQMTISYLEKHKLSGVDIVEAVQSQMPHLDDRTKRSLTELLIRVNVALMMAAVAATTAGGDWSLPEERQRLKDAIARLNAFYVELGSRISRIEGALPRMREEIERFVQK
jgi:hypothetical protein